MLQVRIEALSQHLEQAQDPSVWKQTLDLPLFNVDDRLWNLAVEKIHIEAGELRQTLEVLSVRLYAGEISEPDGWRRYARVQASSEDVFRECLDLLGGLALRDRIQRERICRIADEYIKELSSDTGRRESFAIPGLDVRLFSTLRRVAMVQFPEWSVWTLPLVAHEYGHVVIEESGIKNFAADLTRDATVEEIRRNHAPLVQQMEELELELEPTVQLMDSVGADVDTFQRLLRRPGMAEVEAVVDQLTTIHSRQRRRVRILMADAVATLLAGPAYAYAALLLRLNPLATQREGSTDRERAATILAVLRLMNQHDDDRPPPHGDIVDYVENYWREAITAATGVTQADVADDEPPSPIDPDSLRRAFRHHIVGHKLALYEREHSLQAVQWSDAWWHQLQYGAEMKLPEPATTEHIREALNAAWRARVEATRNLDSSKGSESTHRVESLEQVALDLCDAIVTKRRAARATIDPGGGTNPGRAHRPAGATEAGG
jgi:hypothetical protein